MEVKNSVVESQTQVLGEETTMEIIQGEPVGEEVIDEADNSEGETENEVLETVDEGVVLPNAEIE
jgi:hypothetical protein